MSKWDQLGLLFLIDGANRAELGAHLTDGQGLIEDFQQTMGVELIKSASISMLLEVDGIGLLDVGPQLLSLSVEGVPEAVQEPDCLSLVRESTDVSEFRTISSVGSHILRKEKKRKEKGIYLSILVSVG